MEASTAEQHLAWEEERRPRAALASALAGILLVAAGVWVQLDVYSGAPNVGVLQALGPAFDGQADAEVNPRTTVIRYLDEHAFALIGSTVVAALGLAAAAITLFYLYRAAKARRSETPAFTRFAIVAGAVAVALCSVPIAGRPYGVITQVLLASRADTFVSAGDTSRDAIEQINSGAAPLVISSIGLAGQLAFGLAFVLVALNAMRVGLLTRFLGVLGIICGALFVIPILSPLPVVQVFWFLAVAALVAGRWPNGVPPAWRTGRAELWPTQQELREARERAKGGGGAVALADEDAAEPVKPAHASSKKRRKRRR